MYELFLAGTKYYTRVGTHIYVYFVLHCVVNAKSVRIYISFYYIRVWYIIIIITISGEETRTTATNKNNGMIYCISARKNGAHISWLDRVRGNGQKHSILYVYKETTKWKEKNERTMVLWAWRQSTSIFFLSTVSVRSSLKCYHNIYIYILYN